MDRLYVRLIRWVAVRRRREGDWWAILGNNVRWIAPPFGVVWQLAETRGFHRMTPEWKTLEITRHVHMVGCIDWLEAFLIWLLLMIV